MELLKKCPFCGGEATISVDPEPITDTQGRKWAYIITCNKCAASSGLTYSVEKAVLTWNTRNPMERYEELERKLQSVYGECEGLLEIVVDGLVKHEGAELEKPIRARLLTDEDVDKWDKLKGAKERIVERLEELRMAEYDDSDEEPVYTDIEDIFDDGVSSGKFKAYHEAIKIVKEET